MWGKQQSFTGLRCNSSVRIIELILSQKLELTDHPRAIPSVYQIILMIFAVSGAATIWKETEGFTGAKLLKVLMVDQILYFVMCVCTLSAALTC